jgi:tetratricopeptide (TPR) repeat protein
MDWYPDLSTEAKCRELLDRYPENVLVRDSLATLLQSQGREEEPSQLLALRDGSRSLKYEMGLLIKHERIRHRPDDPDAYLSRGIWHQGFGSYREALSDLDRAIKLRPTIAYAFCSRADLRATCPDDAIRDGRLAIEDALMAMNLAEQAGELIGDWRQRRYLQVLAAAYATNNQFREAITYQTRALDLALTKPARSKISQRLEQYRMAIQSGTRRGS